MIKLGRWLIVGIVLLFMAGLVVSYAAQESQPWMRGRDPLKFGGTLTLARGWEPLTMDSLLTTYGEQSHMYISEPPFMTEPNGEFGPAGWIESIDHSPDELVWTFHIEPGVTFQDGTPLDANAFAWLLRKRITDDSVYSDPLTYIPDVDHIVVVDKYTLQIQQVGQAWPELPLNMATPSWVGAMRTPDAVARYGETYGYKMAYGNGPFELEEWVKGDHLTLARNNDYWWTPSWAAKYAGLTEGEEYHPGPPYLDKLVLEYVPEAATRVAMLKTREVDGIVEVPNSMVEEIKRIPHVKLMGSPSYSIRYIAYNTTKPPLNDEIVRKALNYGVNREAIVNAIYFGYATPAYSPYCGTALEDPNTEHLYKYDPDKAKALLAQDGWKDTNEDGILDKDDQPLHFELWSSNLPNYRKMAVMAQAMWKELGVDVTLRQFDEATLRAKIGAGEHEATVFRHDWVTKNDMYNWWFNPDYKWDPQQTGFDTPELRALIDKTFKAETLDEVNQTNDDLVNYYYEHAAICALVHPENLFAIYDDIVDVVPRSAGWWGWMPYLYDTYRQDVYEANKAAAGK